MIQDQGVKRRLDPVADAEFLACLDIDDLQPAAVVHEDQVGTAGGEPVHPGVKPVAAQEVDGDRDGRLVYRLPGVEAGEEVEGLLDGEGAVGDAAGAVGDEHPPRKPLADDLLLPADPGLEERPGHGAGLDRGGGDTCGIPFLFRGCVVSEVSFAVVVEEPADERGAEVVVRHGLSFSGERISPTVWPGAGKMSLPGGGGAGGLWRRHGKAKIQG